MSDPNTSRANVIEIAGQRPVAPSQNSWAHPTRTDTTVTDEDTETRRTPTSRFKYENKTLPETPEASLSNQVLSRYRMVEQGGQGTSSKSTNRMKYENRPMLVTPKPSPQEKAYGSTRNREQDDRFNPPKVTAHIVDDELMPATPKTSLFGRLRSLTNRRTNTPQALSGLNNAKGRAVTDPVMPKRLFSDHRRNNLEHYIEGEGPRSGEPLSSLQANQNSPKVLRAPPVPHNTPLEGHESRRPQPGNLSVSNPPTRDYIGRSMNPNQTHQVRPNPIHTRRYFEENGMPTPPPSRIPQTQTGSGSRDGVQGSRKTDGVIVGYGNLNPTRTGTYARVGEVGLVEMDETQRVISQAGLIETAGSPSSSDGQRSSGLHLRGSTDQLPHSPHSSSIYGNVWENNPRVGYTLPEFSPAQPHHPYDSESRLREPSSSSAITIPLMFQDVQNDPNRPPFDAPSLNNWVSNSQGNSFVMNAPPARSNGVPPPPAHLYPEYQQSASLQSILTHMEFKLHHHIDTCFGSLSRLMTEKKDNIIDKLITRIDALEKMLPTHFMGLEGKIKEIEKEVSTIASDNEGLREVKDLLSKLCLEFEHMKKVIDEQKRIRIAVPSANEPPTASHRHAQRMHHRTENASASTERGEQYHQYSTSSNQPDTGNNYREGHRRSNTAGDGGAEDGARKDFFAHLGAAIGPVPNLRDHPAYRVAPREVPATGEATGNVASGRSDSDHTLYHVPSFSDGGWYRQAYGS